MPEQATTAAGSSHGPQPSHRTGGQGAFHSAFGRAIRPFQLEVWNYALFGALFGLCFPLVATLIECANQGLPLGWSGYAAVQRGSVLLWIIDTAPLFLGLFAAFGGAQMDKLRKRHQELEEHAAQIERLRDLAEAANKAKGDFLANISHEIRTPMNGIIGLTFLASRTNLTERQRDYIQKIDRSSRSLLRIINDLLDFSKIEAGKLELETTVYATQDMLDGIVDIVNARLAKKNDVEFIIRRSADLPEKLVGDELRLKQVLINLLDNAVKFTQKGEVVLTIGFQAIDQRRGALTCEITDQGIGMSPEQLAGLFDPFSQADVSHTRKYGGTGLGLTICDRIVRMMGGRIAVESEAGKGSRFRFTVEQALKGEHGPHAFHLPFFSRTRALLVDDSSTALTVQGEMLTNMGFDVTQVGSGDAAVEEVQRSLEQDDPFALIVMDWKMPGLNGLDAARMIKQRYRSDAPTVLMVTAYGLEEVRSAAQEGQIDGYLVKPIAPSLLYDTLNVIFKFDMEGVRSRTKEQMNMDLVRRMLSGRHVLLVEDNEINHQVASELLKDAGIEVDHAANGQEALDRFAERRYDGVLMDIQMPVMDGLSATRALRKLPSGAEVPVLAMTAHAMKGEREKSLAAGMNDHLTKPIDPVVLYKSLMQWLCGADEAQLQAVMSTTTTAEEPVPLEIDGLDTRAGLARVAGKPEAYDRLLQAFVKEWSDLGERFRSLWKSRDREALRTTAHTLAGSAGNLGAMELHALAKTLEVLVRDPAQEMSDERIAGTIERIGPLAERILAAVRTHLSIAGKATPAAPANNALDPEAIAEVLELLRKQDASAVKALREMHLDGSDAAVRERVQQALALAEEWEFDQADQILRSLLA
ncbi:MAG: response regulator [Flavobacteriales bacterium]|nr:response regulator [Flavobacteriales bacterium]MCB9194042.1 response regulator [Flavobacteriales bacterium]